MAVDPNRPPGLPSAGGGAPLPPAPPGPPGPPTDPMAAGMQPPMGAAFPTADPQSMLGVLQAMRMQDHAALQQQQDGALGSAVAQLLRQTPNEPGMAATTLPGAPTPPPMPGGDGSAGAPPSALAGAGSGY